MKKFLGMTLTLAAAIALSACSDDSASAAPEENATVSSSDSAVPASSTVPASSQTIESSATVPVSSEEAALLSSSSVTLPASSDDDEPAVPCVDGDPVEVVPDTNGFADIGNVFKSVRCDEKVVFVLRHAEREPSVEKESPLTEEGVEQAKAVGAKLVGPEKFKFTHTDFIRTENTCLNIAIGRGQATFPHDTNNVFQAGWYTKDEDKRTEYNHSDGYNSKKVISAWVFTDAFSDAFYDLAEKSEEIISTQLAKSYEEMPRFRVVCSHDDFVVPLVSYLTNKAINYRTYDMTIVPRPHWANYLSGAAIILNSAGERRTYAIKGLDSGFE